MGGACMPCCICGSQRTTYESPLSPSTKPDPGIELMSSSLAAGIHWTTLMAHPSGSIAAFPGSANPSSFPVYLLVILLILFLIMCVWEGGGLQCPWGPEEGVISPGVGVAGGCELGTNQQEALLASKPCLQPPFTLLKTGLPTGIVSHIWK